MKMRSPSWLLTEFILPVSVHIAITVLMAFYFR